MPKKAKSANETVLKNAVDELIDCIILYAFGSAYFAVKIRQRDYFLTEISDKTTPTALACNVTVTTYSNGVFNLSLNAIIVDSTVFVKDVIITDNAKINDIMLDYFISGDDAYRNIEELIDVLRKAA